MDVWLLRFNVAKCNCVSYGKNLDNVNHIIQYQMKHCILHKTDTVKDLGIIFDTQLKFVDHINTTISKAYQRLGIIKRNFIYLTHTQFSFTV